MNLHIVLAFLMSTLLAAAETQLTHAPRNHDLDQNDNFSSDGQFLVYDTRETAGPGIENSLSIEKVEIATGRTTVLYRPDRFQILQNHAPGVGAVSFSPVADEVVFIHGPDVDELPARGPYGKPNRRGARVPGDGSMRRGWLDFRDIDNTRDTLPGAHRGGTHRHEFARDGRRIGYTYDDFLLPQYDRTVGYMEPHAKAPGDASHYCAVLVPVVPKNTSRAGELEKAYGDSWVDRAGTMRAYIGVVREEDGTLQQSLFVADIPPGVDITSSDSGGPERFPAPPEGITQRRLTHTWAEGIVRGSTGGDQVAYFARAADGTVQVFVIRADGSGAPTQVTAAPGGLNEKLGMRWHTNDEHLIVCVDGGIALASVRSGAAQPLQWLTPHGDGVERSRPVVSPDGRLLAYNRPAPTLGPDGSVVHNYSGQDFVQIFTVPLPE